MKKFILILAVIFAMVANVNLNCHPIEPLDTDSDGYRNITTIHHLEWFSTVGPLYQNYELDNDIDALETGSWNGYRGFLGIGRDTLLGFTGIFEGHDRTIFDVRMNPLQGECAGFFNIISGGQVRNLHLYDCFIDAPNAKCVGILAGAVVGIGSSVYNCTSIIGGINAPMCAGGLIGFNLEGVITNSGSTTNVSGGFWSGGFIGSNGGCIPPYTVLVIGGPAPSLSDPYCQASPSIIQNCYAEGNVNGNDCGGFVGINFKFGLISKSCCKGTIVGQNNGGFVSINQYGDITNCYSRSNLTGQGTGFVCQPNHLSIYFGSGWHDYGDITDCFSTGLLNSASSACFVDRVDDNYDIFHQCFYEDNVPVCPSIAGHFESKNTTQMKTASTYTYVGWDFYTIWEINTENNSYPSFRGLDNRKPNLETKNLTNSKNINIFPNPAESVINVEFNLGKETIGSILVYNNFGQLVATIKNSEQLYQGLNKIQFDTKDLQSGVYYLSVNLDGNTISSTFSVSR